MALVVFVVGAPRIGKTKLLDTLVQSKSCDLGPTLGIELRTWSYTLKDQLLRFRIFDVSGRSIYADLLAPDVQMADIAVICYDISDITTLDRAKRFLTLVEQSHIKRNVILCGCIVKGNTRQVMPDELYHLTQKALNRGNCLSIQGIETRLDDRVPLFQAVIRAAVSQKV